MLRPASTIQPFDGPHDERSDRAAGTTFGIVVAAACLASLSLLPAQPLPTRAAASASPDAPAPQPSEAAKVLTPAESIASFTLAPGISISVAASEPAVVAPVAGAFDEDGRLWIVEMLTFMPDVKGSGELEPRNRIVVLTDADHDGVFERSQVFLDGLTLPRSVAPCFGGALVLEPPSLYFCKDTDGDGHADVKQHLLDGFGGLDNPEHAANSITYGLDNWYHLAQHTIEFRFDGHTIVTRPTPAIGQWGLAQDAQGRLYTTPNSDPLLIDLLPRHYAARNPHAGGASFLGRSIVRDKSVYPVHPTPGVNRGYQPGILREDGTLRNVTAACAPLIYDSDSLGPGLRGSALVCEPAGNAVKRYLFSGSDDIPAAGNAYDHAELIASPDERFRPVNLISGPDGAVYLLDLYRGVLQHKNFLTPFLSAQAKARSLEHPLDRGRVYRITASAPRAAPEPPHLSTASNAELVRLLAHEDMWWRMTAQRLLVERHAVDVTPSLRDMARSGSTEQSRLHALWTLEGIGALAPDDALAATKDESAPIRCAGARLAEPFLKAPAVATCLTGLLDDPDRWVRVQSVCSLGELPPEERVGALAGVLKRFSGDRFMREAALSGLDGLELTILQSLVQDRDWVSSRNARFSLDALADAILRSSSAVRADFVDAVAAMASEDDPAAPSLLARIRVAQHLDSDKPRPIALSREPTRWIHALAEPFNDHVREMTESADYFDWPNRPVVRRVAGTRPLTTSELERFERGRVIFSQICASCHGANGGGSSGQGAPLGASVIAEGPADRFAGVLIRGLEGTWKLGDLTYEAAMPPAPVPGDDDLAAVMTFVRRSFGNAAEPVKTEDVAAARAKLAERERPFSRTELGVAPK